MKSIFQKGFMYKISCNPASTFYIAENKTLAGKEDRTYDGEALGRKLVITFFEDGPGGLVQPVDRTSLGMKQQLLTLAELLQTLGGLALPDDPDRTAGQTELLLEAHYQILEVKRFVCTLETAAEGVHMYSLEDEVDAEAAFASEVNREHRTKMVLARALQRNEELLDGETLQNAWNLSLAQLQGRTAHLYPAPPAPVAPPGGRGGGRGRGRGRGRAPLVAPDAPAGRGRGRARGRGR